MRVFLLNSKRMNDIERLYKYYKESQSVCTDTRTMEENCLFFCLSGENFNGNTFAKEALEKGASFVVIDEPEYKLNERCICVENTLTALQQLAVYHRDRLQIPIIGITGTNGKTTTKELVHAVLSEKYKVTATKGNLNNHIGVPLTILSIKSDTEIAIVEMGANHVGEIAFLCEIAKPTMGIITNIGKAHLEGFGSVKGIIETKTALYQSVKKSNGLLFVNADDDLLMNYACHCGLDPQSLDEESGKRFTCGKTGDCKGFYSDDSLLLKLHLYNYNVEIQTQLTGSYNFCNAMAAVAVGECFSVPVEKITHALSSYTPDNSRSQIIKKGEHTIILDAYNANPSSMKLAIENIAKMNVENKVLLLGDMSELGNNSLREHQYIVDLIRSFSFDYVYLLGNEFAKTDANLAWLYQDYEQLKNALKEELPNNATVLIKGSRSMKMEWFLEGIV